MVGVFIGGDGGGIGYISNSVYLICGGRVGTRVEKDSSVRTGSSLTLELGLLEGREKLASSRITRTMNIGDTACHHCRVSAGPGSDVCLTLTSFFNIAISFLVDNGIPGSRCHLTSNDVCEDDYRVVRLSSERTTFIDGLHNLSRRSYSRIVGFVR